MPVLFGGGASAQDLATIADHAASVVTIEAGGYPADDPDLDTAVTAALADLAPAVANYAALGAAATAGTRRTTTDTGLVWTSNGSAWRPRVLYDAVGASTVQIGEQLWADELSAVGDGNPIDAWTGTHTWTQTGVERPTWVSGGGPGGGGHVDFDSTQYFDGDAGAKALLNGVSYATALVVCRWDAIAQGVPFDFSVNGGTGTKFRYRIQSSAASIDGRRLDADASTSSRTVARPTVSTWGLLVVEGLWGAGDCQGWLSEAGLSVPPGGASALLASGSWTSAGATSATDSQVARIGTNTVDSLPFDGQIAAFVILNHSARLSSKVLGSAMAWVAARTGLV